MQPLIEKIAIISRSFDITDILIPRKNIHKSLVQDILEYVLLVMCSGVYQVFIEPQE